MKDYQWNEFMEFNKIMCDELVKRKTRGFSENVERARQEHAKKEEENKRKLEAFIKNTREDAEKRNAERYNDMLKKVGQYKETDPLLYKRLVEHARRLYGCHPEDGR
ncbi:MAG: hypothetical protein LBT45_01370 [Rickettsiales bacterium]|jgi:soluble lytic murein transglycosylase-like protein|nr:hypothetical protein [Rickettsiales bacterium]